ncbi:MAG: hypothetical protein GTO45_23315 [Candidatus Aminicenantes bacterium]|nr:hypothetical protein [Candidatus Aminicenantes bacterium]NIM81687.1 hypothetical protein [Candidatus Aminicenantes bacterium]NIN21058.1 hypothetical protein [Candidatus Aminicenantes bacterium]NIN44880.1 hypothetical protein [Candidatus Aminicenantes bacterium]NIN87694.1 hypothetical protein [Candidatus Aminicenantes bacterium]
MNIREEVEELKEMLQTEEDFGAIAQKFMNLTESSKFLEMGKFKKNKLLETVVNKALSDIDMPGILGIRISYIRKFNFYHGSFITEFLPGAVIYFSDIQMGLIVVPRDFKGNNSYFRFTGTIVAPGSFTAVKKSEENH